jgi:hypothetical protein
MTTTTTTTAKKRPRGNCSANDDSDDDGDSSSSSPSCSGDAGGFVAEAKRQKKAATSPVDNSCGGEEEDEEEEEEEEITLERQIKRLVQGTLVGMQGPTGRETTRRSALIISAFAELTDMLWWAMEEEEMEDEKGAEHGDWPGAKCRGKAGDGAGNLSAVLALLDRYDACGTALARPHSASVLEEGLGFVSQYAAASRRGAQKLWGFYAVHVILPALRQFPDHEDLQGVAVEALANLLFHGRAVAKKDFVWACAGLPPVLSAMERYPDNCTLQAGAVALLAWICQVEELRPALVEAGALRLVVIAAERHGTRDSAAGSDDAATAASGAGAFEPSTNGIQRLANRIVDQLGAGLVKDGAVCCDVG